MIYAQRFDSQPPIKALREKNNLYTRDLAKYEDVLPKNEAKKNKLLHWIDTMRDDLIKNGAILFYNSRKDQY